MTRSSDRRARRSERPAAPRARRARPPRFDARALEDPPWVWKAGWVAIAATIAVLAWLAFGLHQVGDYFTESDFYGGYAEGASLARQGRIDPARNGIYGPVYELALAGLSFAIPDLFTAARVLSVSASAATLACVFVLIARRTRAAVGLWTVLFAGANAVFLRYGFSATTDALAVALQWGSLLAVLGARGRWSPLAAGVLAALATLTRYSAVALVPAAVVCYLWPGAALPAATRAATPGVPSDAGPQLPSSLPARAPWRAIALYLAGFAALVVPWTLFSLAHGHLPGERLFSTYSAFYANPDPSRNVQDLLPAARDSVLAAEPRSALAPARLARAAFDHLRLDLDVLLGWPAALACGAGLLVMLVERRWRTLAPLWLAGAFLFAALLPVFHSDRYSLPWLPIYLSLAGLAAAASRPALALGSARVPLVWAAALVPLAFSIRDASLELREVLGQTPLEVVEAGRALRRVAPPGARVLARKGHIGYYAGLPVVAFPRLRSVPELAAHCRGHDVDYIYFSWYEAELRPEFWALLDTTERLPGLEVVHAADRNPAVVYRIGPEFGRVPAWFANDTLRRLQEARAQVRALPDEHAWGAHLVLGTNHAAGGRPSEAADHFRQVTRNAPGVAAGWVGLGDAEMRLGRLEDAAQSLRRGLALDPAGPAARMLLGAVELQAGRPQAAAEIWRPLVAEVRDPRILALMLPAFEQAGDRATAAAVRAALARAGAPQPGPAR